MEKACFAAGCFGRVEEPFRNVPGVLWTQVGYTGGHMREPSYGDVCTGATGHSEALEVEFDPERVRYDDLLEVFWKIHDPTQLDRRRPDVGNQYRSVIFIHSPEQEAAARASKERAQARFSKPIVTEIEPASEFYPAEESHQRFVDKRPSVTFAR
jgi:peptide-methionine (S)-S-oxide reductase